MGQLKTFKRNELVQCNYCDGITPEFMKEFHTCPTREALAKQIKASLTADTPNPTYTHNN